MRRDWWWRFLARVLPWFDEASWDRERESTRRVLEQADKVMTGRARIDGIRSAYQSTAKVTRRR